jgi:DnaJ-class molecular chaperone
MISTISSKTEIEHQEEEQMTDITLGKLVECRYCEGTGKVREHDHLGPLAIGSKKKSCPACGGSGFQRV